MFTVIKIIRSTTDDDGIMVHGIVYVPSLARERCEYIHILMCGMKNFNAIPYKWYAFLYLDGNLTEYDINFQFEIIQYSNRHQTNQFEATWNTF